MAGRGGGSYFPLVVDCSLQAGSESVLQVKEFKCLRILFIGGVEVDGAVSAVMQVKLLIYKSVYVPTLSYDHELWVVTEKMRSWTQVAKISFFS